MSTAFQSNAFQNNAFQIFGSNVPTGEAKRRHEELKKRRLEATKKKFEQVKKIIEEVEIVPKEEKEEFIKRKERFTSNGILDFNRLGGNVVAIRNLDAMLERLLQIEQEYIEILFILLIIDEADK